MIDRDELQIGKLYASEDHMVIVVPKLPRMIRTTGDMKNLLAASVKLRKSHPFMVLARHLEGKSKTVFYYVVFANNGKNQKGFVNSAQFGKGKTLIQVAEKAKQ